MNTYPQDPVGETGPSQGEVFGAHWLATAVGLQAHHRGEGLGIGWTLTCQMNSLYGPWANRDLSLGISCSIFEMGSLEQLSGSEMNLGTHPWRC